MASIPPYYDDPRLILARLVADHARLRRLIGRKIPRRVQSLLDAEDVLQETALELLAPRAPKPGAHIGNVSHWLAGLALHRLHDLWVELAPDVRAASSGRGQDAGGESRSEPRAFGRLEWPGINPGAACALRESAAAVQAMLGCLTVEQRFVVEQVDLEDRSAAQIAESTGWTRAAVWKRYERARRKLIARFGDAAAALLRD